MEQTMSEKLRSILKQIRELESELKATLQEQEAMVSYRIEGSKVRFDTAARAVHKSLRTGLFRWLRSGRPQSYLSAPIIYSMIIPIAVFDLSLTLYQNICFRLYDIARVKRADFVVIDRHQLAYLNIIEKLNCGYCSYFNGLIAYIQEIAARTEQYWCPIKHARKMTDVHPRYDAFLNYGDANSYPVELIDFRVALKEGREGVNARACQRS